QISIQNSGGCAIKIDRTLWCWGLNGSGQMGIGAASTYAKATQVLLSTGGNGTNWVQVASNGGTSFCAIDTSGAVWCSGQNAQGIGGDTNTGLKTSFYKSATLTSGVIQIAASYSGTYCVLKNTGAVACWGNNIGYIAGDATQSAKTSTLYTGYLLDSGVNYIDLGDYGGCASKSGQMFCWGLNIYNMFSGGATTNAYGPIQANSSTFDLTKGIVDFSINQGSTNSTLGSICAVNYLGATACSGSNGGGLLNNGDTVSRTEIAPTRWTSGVTGIASSGYSTCVVVNGNVQCAGDNSIGMLGVGNLTPFKLASGPVNATIFKGKVGVLDQDPSGITVSTSQNYVVGNTVSTTLAGDAHPTPSATYAWYTCTNTGNATTNVPGDCSPISGATTSTYTIAAGDSAANIRVAVTLTNLLGTATTVSATGTVGTVPTVVATPSGNITGGTLKLLTNQTLTQPSVSFTGTPTPAISYKWYRCVSSQASWVTTLPSNCYPVEGGTATSYTTTHGDDGFYLISSTTATSTAGSLTYFSPSTSTSVIYANSISLGSFYHYCAVKAGKVYCWGTQSGTTDGGLGNEYLKAGPGSVNNTPITPIKLANGKALTSVISISVGRQSACAVTYSGSAYCWGSNTYGQLGDGGTTNRWTAAPVMVDASTPLTNIVQIGVSGTTSSVSTCALTSAGAVICWGSDTNISGTGAIYYATRIVSTLTSGVQQLAVGPAHACVIVSAAVKCWGSNASGRSSADTGVTSQSTPFAIPSRYINQKLVTLSQGVSNVSPSGSSTCAVRLGKVWCWGDNSLSTWNSSSTNEFLPGETQDDGTRLLDSDVLQVISGYVDAGTSSLSTCVLKVGGSVYCNGQNANGSGNVAVNSETALLATNLSSGVTEFNAGQTSTCGVKSGALYCAGSNTYYMMLDGTTAAASIHASLPFFADSLGISESAPVAGTAGISGYAAIGSDLTSVYSDYQQSGAWQGVPTPAMTNQWYLCDSVGSSTATLPSDCSAISGANGATYTVLQAQTGKYFRTGITGTNPAGSATVYSAAYGPVDVAPSVATTASIGVSSGPVLSTSNTITGTPGTITGAQTVTTINQWFHCSNSGTATTTKPSDCVAIPGATQTTYRPATSDITGYLRFATIGTNANGQAGTWSDTSTIVYQGNLVAVMDKVTCAIRTGRVYCWGTNTDFGFGTANNVSTSTVTSPSAAIPVVKTGGATLENVISIVSTNNRICALDSSGGVWCWGVNGTNYVMGNNTTTTIYTAANPNNAADGTVFTSGVVGITLDQVATCVWKTTGAAYCWGGGASYQNGSASTQTIPAAVAGLSSGVTKMTLSAGAGCAIKSGAVYCWGDGSTSPVGSDGGGNFSTPTLRASLSTNDFQDITA
ncbi:MAG: hypothetical protein RL545_522, partial [Actinomycetota bacterium]